MSSHLDSFKESLSADDVEEDIEFAAFDPESNSQSTTLEEAAPDAGAPNWFKPKTSPAGESDNSSSDSNDVEFASADDSLKQLNLKEPPPPPKKSDKKRKTRGSKPAPPPLDKKRKSASDPAATLEAEPEEEAEPVKWQRRIVLWFLSAAAGGYGISLLFHFIVLIALSLIIYSTMDENEAISMTLSDADGLLTDLEETVMLETAPAGGAEQFAELKPVALEDSPQSEASIDIPSMMGKGEGDGGSDDDGFAFRMPTGGGVTKKGSFSAWTVPKDPKPGQDYQIVIRIKLSKSSRKYRVDDLSGTVIGTDGYNLVIPFDRRKLDKTKAEKNGKLLPVKPGEYLKIVNNHVQLVVDIPGAAGLVKDTIEVRSKKLKENQKLVIEF
jgi:hypothetical protein